MKPQASVSHTESLVHHCTTYAEAAWESSHKHPFTNWYTAKGIETYLVVISITNRVQTPLARASNKGTVLKSKSYPTC